MNIIHKSVSSPLKEAGQFTRYMRTLTVGALVLGLSLLLSGNASAQSKELIDAAKKEGKVMVYGELITPTMRAIKKGFESKYPGITMEFIYLSGAPLMNRIVSEQDAGRHLADVIAIDTVRMPILKDKGYLTQYSSANKGIYPTEWHSVPADYWIRNHLYLGGVMYNDKSVSPKDAPKSYQDLLDPKWKGKIAMVSPVANDLIFAMFAGIVQDMGEKAAYEYFEKLAKQNPLVFGPGGIRVSQGVGTGEFPIGIGFIGHVFSVGTQPGYNMRLADVSPLYAVGGPGFAVAKNAPNPNAARLITDYMLSREAQEMIAGIGYRSNADGVTGIKELTEAKISVAPVLTGDAAVKLRAKLRQLFGG